MHRNILVAAAAMLTCVLGMAILQPSALAQRVVTIFLDGRQIHSDVDPIIVNGRTMVPIRAISEGLGLDVDWDNDQYQVIISSPAAPVSGTNSASAATDISIRGQSILSAAQLQALMLKNNPDAPRELPALYLRIGAEYGIRGDIAFCQAAKETGWWKYGGLVQPYQNNYCGLSATGQAATGLEDLRGADPSQVRFENGVHGAIFTTPEAGVEAHIQHLYAYTCREPLPAGKSLVDPRYILVTRGIAPLWSDLNGRWAVPGVGYGESILLDYYYKAFNNTANSGLSTQERIKQLEMENQLLKQEINQLKAW
ncbi:MAG: stalk domain-containing protein [Syntrophomonadaceae bacterium]|jgi:hypothetical protein